MIYWDTETSWAIWWLDSDNQSLLHSENEDRGLDAVLCDTTAAKTTLLQVKHHVVPKSQNQKGRITEEHWDLNDTEWRLIGLEKDKKMIRQCGKV